MPRRKRKYTDAEKAAYYKNKYMQGKGDYTYPAGRSRYVKGHGAYKIPKGYYAKQGRKVGGFVGSQSPIAPGIFGAVGSEVGSALGHQVARLVGHGDYQVKTNSLTNPTKNIPTFGKDSIRVRKRELIAILDSVDGFSNLKMPIQPGSDTSFPWLSRIAANYENYHFNGIVYEYRSTSSDSISSTTDLGLGTVCLATDYNASDSAYVDLQQTLGSMFANSGKPSHNLLHAIECAPKETQQKSYYIRTGDLPPGSDVKLYDMGNLQFVVQGVANYAGMGQLWVSYDITLFKSVMNNQLGLALNTDHYVLTAPAVTAQYFGVTRTADTRNNLGSVVTGDVIAFPPTLASGYYQITYTANGTSTVLSQPGVAFVNCTAMAAWLNNTDTRESNTGSTSNIYLDNFIVRIDGNNATITLSGGTLPSATTFGDLIITQVNGDIFN